MPTKDYAKLLHEDLRLRKELKTRLSHAGVAEIDIERTANKIRVNIFSARPGIIIGRKGAEVDKLGAELRAVYGQDIHINIQEIQRPEIEAQLIAESIASQLVRRITFRRAMRRAMENALRFGAQGDQNPLFGSPQRGRDRPLRVVPGGAASAPHPEGRHRVRLRRGLHDLRGDRRQGVDLQGRAAPQQGPPARAVRDEVLPC